MFTYGLSIYGPLLWILGLPATHNRNEIELNLTLRRGADGPPLWQHVVRGAESSTGWIYGLGTDFTYDRLLRAAMPELLASLTDTVDGATFRSASSR